MSNYNYYQHLNGRLIDRFNDIEEYSDGYYADGLDQWRVFMDLLLRYLIPPDETERRETSWGEEKERIRGSILDEVRVLYSGEVRGSLSPEDGRFGRRFQVRPVEEWILLLLLGQLRRLRNGAPANKCPRLFISHRQTDKGYALRMARLAENNNFAYWVDVLDPLLNMHSPMPGIPQSLYTACVVEMALLNCTHVIALITPNSPGSVWVPYEYGRIKDGFLISTNTAAWIHPRFARRKFPDYMRLGEMMFNETEIEKWMADEYYFQSRMKPGCRPRHEDPEVFQGEEKLPDTLAEAGDALPEKIEIDIGVKEGTRILRPFVLKTPQKHL